MRYRLARYLLEAYLPICYYILIRAQRPPEEARDSGAHAGGPDFAARGRAGCAVASSHRDGKPRQACVISALFHHSRVLRSVSYWLYFIALLCREKC